MKITFQPKTAQRLLLVLLTAILCVTATFAQSDEQTIRDMIKQENENQVRPKTTEEVILAPVGTPRPFVGKQAYVAGIQELSKMRPNTKLNRVPERVVVAESKDLAYEYGNQTMSWDKPEGGRSEGQGSYIRIWRKINGEWLLEAFMARPNQ